MKKEDIDKLTLGADPELILHKNGQIAPANQYFNSHDEFGCDGNSTVAELRPKPSKTPWGLISYIAQLIDWGHKEFPELKMMAGAMAYDYAIGGHIHISTPASPNKINNLNALLGTLENHLYPSSDIEKRRSNGYGQPASFRRKDYGIEYRAPVSWLTSPIIALAYLTLAKIAVVNDEINISDIITNQEEGVKVLRNIKKYFDIIPEDCEMGLSYMNEVLDTPLEAWGDDIIPHWQED